MADSRIFLEDWLRRATAALKTAGIESPRKEARLLALLGLGLSPTTVSTDRDLTPSEWRRLNDFLERRCSREPISRLFGTRGFWTFDLTISAETLDPRPDTEILVETALKALPGTEPEPTIVDVGTGSGCVLLALLSERPAAIGLGVDISEAAAVTAAANARTLGLADRSRFVVGDLLAPIGSGLSMVVSNPPYIPTGEIATLAPEVRNHDPLRALDGGDDGLDFYRVLIPQSFERLRTGGVLAVEIGPSQAGDVARMFVDAGFATIAVNHDLGGRDRCVMGRKPE